MYGEHIDDIGHPDPPSRQNSGTTSPLTTSGGIITKRGPQVEQVGWKLSF